MAEYTPGILVGSGAAQSEPSTTELFSYLRAELDKISQSFNQASDFIQLSKLNVAPAKPREGMVVLADGTNWNPGAGAGFYGYYGAAWTKLG